MLVTNDDQEESIFISSEAPPPLPPSQLHPTNHSGRSSYPGPSWWKISNLIWRVSKIVLQLLDFQRRRVMVWVGVVPGRPSFQLKSWMCPRIRRRHHIYVYLLYLHRGTISTQHEHNTPQSSSLHQGYLSSPTLIRLGSMFDRPMSRPSSLILRTHTDTHISLLCIKLLSRNSQICQRKQNINNNTRKIGRKDEIYFTFINTLFSYLPEATAEN